MSLLIGAIDHRYNRPAEYAWHASMAAALGAFLMDGGWNTGLPQRVFFYLIPMVLLAIGINILYRYKKKIPHRTPSSPEPAPANE